VNIKVNVLGVERTFNDPDPALDWVREVLFAAEPDELLIFAGIPGEDVSTPPPDSDSKPSDFTDLKKWAENLVIGLEVLNSVIDAGKTGAKK